MSKRPISKFLVISIKAILLLLGFGLLISCKEQPVYQTFNDLPDHVWYYDSIQTFQFEIVEKDVPYNLSYQVRNSLDYPYYNLFVHYELLNEKGLIQRSNLHEAYLMHPKTGKPYGSGAGTLFSHSIPLLTDYQFQESGKYTFRIKQYMCMDTLPELYAVGFAIEKNKP